MSFPSSEPESCLLRFEPSELTDRLKGNCWGELVSRVGEVISCEGEPLSWEEPVNWVGEVISREGEVSRKLGLRLGEEEFEEVMRDEEEVRGWGEEDVMRDEEEIGWEEEVGSASRGEEGMIPR